LVINGEEDDSNEQRARYPSANLTNTSHLLEDMLITTSLDYYAWLSLASARWFCTLRPWPTFDQEQQRTLYI
jgi:hypothetical protein